MSKVMTEKTNNGARDGRRGALIAAISTVAALAVFLAAFASCKNAVFYYIAKNRAEKNEFSAAVGFAEKAGAEKSGALAEYARLRIEINKDYPAALSRFDAEQIARWRQTASRLSREGKLPDGKIRSEAARLESVLSVVEDRYREYEAVRPRILSLMDVFAEINALHNKRDDGKNVAFTVASEREKLARWRSDNDALARFASEIPNGEKAYLLNYLIKEALGECSDLEAAMDSIVESGYSETDSVRFSGESRKSFPNMTNDRGESVNLLEKENYEKYMKKGVCRALVESLGIFFIP